MISVLIYTHNEKKNISECIQSAKLLTRNIFVIDQESDDETPYLSKKEGAIVFNTDYLKYVEPAREFGIEKINTPWVFILDADERISVQLAQEIKQIVKQTNFSHFMVPRRNIFGKKKWLQHGGWWPDYQIRLIQKKSFKAWPKEIHSTPQILGTLGILKNPLLHFFHGDIASMVDKTIVFETIEAGMLNRANRPVSTPIFFRKFLGELNRRLIMKRGFLDGSIGIIESIYQAFSKTITYLFLYEKKQKSSTLQSLS